MGVYPEHLFILNLHIHFQSAQNQHELSTAAQCWNTATTEKRNIWLPSGINLSYERQFKGKYTLMTSLSETSTQPGVGSQVFTEAGL